MPVPEGRRDDPVLCTFCGHVFGVIGDYADGDEIDCPECPGRYRIEMPSQDEINARRAEARELLKDPAVTGRDNPEHEDALARVRTVPIHEEGD